MKKAVIISVNPRMAEAILNGDKTIEVRKTAPKCNLPIDVYVYCTKSRNHYLLNKKVVSNGKYEAITTREMHDPNKTVNIEPDSPCVLNGKVVARFTLNKLDEILNRGSIDQTDTMYTKYFCGYRKSGIMHETIEETRLLKDSHLLYRELDGYLLGNKGYAWHISDLEIIDYPLFVDDFYKTIEEKKCTECEEHCRFYMSKNTMSGKQNTGCHRYYRLVEAPKSWCYIME